MAVVVAVIVNPIELTKRGRDATRLTDLQSLNNAINVAAQEATQSGQYILCNGATPPCPGDSYPGTQANRSANGTGWVKVNLSTAKAVSVPVLPVDPINDGNGATNYHYQYDTNAAGDKWEIDAALESQQYQGKMSQDGGSDPNKWEVGSDLTIL